MTSINQAESLQLLNLVEDLKNNLEGFCTGGGSEENFNNTYKEIRLQVIAKKELKKLIPKFILDCRDLGEFWAFIKHEIPTYAGRRKYLKDEFQLLRNFLEEKSILARSKKVDADLVLKTFNEDEIYDLWQKANDRKETDIDGALTAARTLIESICKHILQERNIEFNDQAELPTLYGLVARSLNLAPSQHTEEIYKQILGGCHSVIQGLGSVRSKLGDAHGKIKGAPKASRRHAELSVNLSGSMALFLIQTHQEKISKSSSQ